MSILETKELKSNILERTEFVKMCTNFFQNKVYLIIIKDR